MAENDRLGKEEEEALCARAAATTTMATGEGGGEGGVDMKGRRGRVLLSGLRHCN